jgi:hypothetical protein
MSGCASFIGTQTPRLGTDYCDIARPIYPSVHDTTETKRQVAREDSKWKRLCGTR